MDVEQHVADDRNIFSGHRDTFVANVSEMTNTNLCELCQRECSRASVLFWDGREYCEQCLEQRLVGLAHTARALDALRELIEPDEIGIRRLLLSFTLGCIVVVSVVFGIPLAFCVAGGQASILHVSIFLGLVIGVTMAMMTAALWLGANRIRADLPMIAQIQNGRVSIETQSFNYTCELGESSWDFGSTANAPVACYTPNCAAILLRTPRLRVAFRVRSDEERRVWEAFLGIAGVRRESLLDRLGFRIRIGSGSGPGGPG